MKTIFTCKPTVAGFECPNVAHFFNVASSQAFREYRLITFEPKHVGNSDISYQLHNCISTICILECARESPIPFYLTGSPSALLTTTSFRHVLLTHINTQLIWVAWKHSPCPGESPIWRTPPRPCKLRETTQWAGVVHKPSCQSKRKVILTVMCVKKTRSNEKRTNNLRAMH